MSTSVNIQYDNALLGILQHEGKIEKFIDVIFSFLMRRTDFYHIMTADQKKLGFPAGFNRKMVLETFEKYKSVFQEFENERKSTQTPVIPQERPELEVAQTVEVATATDVNATEQQGRSSNGEKKDEENDGAPVVYQADPDWYNGAIRDKYSWSQSIRDVDIKVKIPNHVKSARELGVQIKRQSVKVSLKNGDVEEPYVEGKLCWEVLRDESMWTFHAKEHILHISLDKVQERWWEAVFEGEEKINTRKIDCSRPMHELDDEAQAKIQQLIFDERQKRMGMPTSEQQKVHDVLAKAWDQEGSPFRGTPFDPTKVSIAASDAI